MAQLRQDYPKFRAQNTEVLVMVPNGPNMIERHIWLNDTPYPILSDIGARVAEQYSVEVQRSVPFFKVFTPSVFLVNTSGEICYTEYSPSYTSEPDNQKPLAILARLTDENLPG